MDLEDKGYYLSGMVNEKTDAFVEADFAPTPEQMITRKMPEEDSQVRMALNLKPRGVDAQSVGEVGSDAGVSAPAEIKVAMEGFV